MSSKRRRNPAVQKLHELYTARKQTDEAIADTQADAFVELATEFQLNELDEKAGLTAALVRIETDLRTVRGEVVGIVRATDAQGLALQRQTELHAQQSRATDHILLTLDTMLAEITRLRTVVEPTEQRRALADGA